MQLQHSSFQLGEFTYLTLGRRRYAKEKGRLRIAITTEEYEQALKEFKLKP